MRFIKSVDGKSVLLGWKRIIYEPLFALGSILKDDLYFAVHSFMNEQRGLSHPVYFVRGKDKSSPRYYTIEFPWRDHLVIGCCEFDKETTKKIFKWLDISF